MKSIVEKIENDWKDIPLEEKKGMVEDYLDEVIEDLPLDIANQAIFHLTLGLDSKTINDLKEEFKKNGIVWWTRHHYRLFGVNVRNMLRDLVCPDSDLPTGHWEDYYSQLIEVVIGMRRVEAFEK